MWTWRNKALHGPSKKDQEKRKTEILHKKVDQLYDRLSTITHHNTPEVRNIFGKDERTMRKKIRDRGTSWMEIWIKTAEDLLDSMDKRDTNTIDQWIIRESTKLKDGM